MGIIENIAGAFFGLLISGIMVFRSHDVANFLKKAYRNFPHDKSVLSDEQYEVRSVYIVVLGGMGLAISLIGLIANLS